MWIFQSLTVAVLLTLAAAFFAWRAVRTARTPQGAVGWTVFLLAAPWFALPTYMVFGHHKYRGYVAARRDSVEVVRELRKFGDTFIPDDPPNFAIEAFENIAAMPAVSGNGFRLIENGPDTFDAIFEAMDAAQNYILVQFYTIRDDAIGRRMKDRLLAAAERGVLIRVMFDGVGSSGLTRAYRQELAQAGIEAVDPRAARGPTSRIDINFRNHRKTVIVDGRVGFIGGHNVGDEYMGGHPTYGDWRDTHIRITGPMVQQLQLIYIEDWHWATEDDLRDHLEWTPEADPENRTGLIVATGPGDEMDTGGLFYFSAICEARERVWIASPYFVPDTDVLTALKHAAITGLDVRILVPDVIDHYMPWLAAYAYFDEVRAAGVKILRYQGDFMHQKVIIADDVMAAIGTTNLDNRSFRLNFEAMAVFFDKDVVKETEAMLERDFANAVALETDLPDQNWKIRLGAPIARLFSPIL